MRGLGLPLELVIQACIPDGGGIWWQVVAELLVGRLFPVRLSAYSCSETGLWVPVSTLESRRIFEVFCITTFDDLTTSCSMLRYMTFHADV